METAFVVTYTEYEYSDSDDNDKTVDVIGVYPTKEAAQDGITQLYVERGLKGRNRYNPGREIDGEIYSLRGTESILTVPVGQFSKYGW